MRLLFLSILTACLVAGSACESTGGSGQDLFSNWGSGGHKEKWTIRCYRSEGPNHAQQCQQLANMLQKVRQLDARKVRMVSNATGSTIYYGEYAKVPQQGSSILVFPPAFQQDIGLIRQLGFNQQAIFTGAKPELLVKGSDSTGQQDWDIANAKGKYTLQISVFYNTPTFDQRIFAAEEYVRILREEGISAYYRHQPGRSFVFVGDFDDSDLVGTWPDAKFGPSIKRFIAQREQEFRYMLENGHPIKRSAGDGKMIIPPSILIPVPKEEPRY